LPSRSKSTAATVFPADLCRTDDSASAGALEPAERPSHTALKTIEAQRQADQVVRQLVAGEIDAEGLALVLAEAYGAKLQALARALTKAARGGN
jgi:hypothetical protein